MPPNKEPVLVTEINEDIVLKNLDIETVVDKENIPHGITNQPRDSAQMVWVESRPRKQGPQGNSPTRRPHVTGLSQRPNLRGTLHVDQPVLSNMQHTSNRSWPSRNYSAQVLQSRNKVARRASPPLGISPDKAPREVALGVVSWDKPCTIMCGSHPDEKMVGIMVQQNSQGADSRSFLNTLKEHVRMQHPHIIVLLETYVSGSRTYAVCNSIGFQGQFRELWDKLESWASSNNRPWLMVGTFNETRSLEERNHGGPDMARHCSKFNDWIENNALIDIGFSGLKFTWGLKFQEGGIKHWVWTQSDHAPILISTSGFSTRTSETKPFLFQATWMLRKGFDNLLRQFWAPSSSLNESLKRLTERLNNWNMNVLGNLFRNKRKLWGRIEGVQKRLDEGRPRHLLKLEKRLHLQLDKVLDQI
ncbi:hypothetical protein Cgig2_003718 [Carnegiea gigantea]|uniref:Endonuclease/exonuclease/phosphatase domain-containing protein n=1 Tax=Carnegiea gigantea TaxID=171969 RepID=A0A9Q1KGY0_9CARY|nr:hypothetical protein Cgig2_003718 [Carnegiea gigantea]